MKYITIRNLNFMASSILILVMLAFWASLAHATEAIPTASNRFGATRIGAGNKVLKNSFSIANLMGLNYIHYESEEFFIGGAIYTGQLSNGATGSYSEGGLVAGYQWQIGNSNTLVDANVMFGNGGGNSVPNVGSGMIINPSFGVDLGLGRRLRGIINVGYDWNPSYPSFSSVTGEFRIDFLYFD